ncbi:hypothetical protein IW262DRAFT_1464254 [Armillaria fumosa]|nr:hypothetical protein IW262DRAFT_1464254 [Armillaria fumosa]
MSPKSPHAADEAQPTPPRQETEYGSDDSQTQRRLHKSRRLAANAYKQRHPEVTEIEILTKYPPVPAPRKKTKRQIEASQRRDSESMEEFTKRLSQTPVPGPSEKERPQSRPSAVPNTNTESPPIPVGAIPVPPSPPIDPVLLAYKPPPRAPSRILCESGTQTNDDATIQSQTRHITDFGVGALGVHPDAPTITWDRILQPKSSPAPTRITLPHIPQDNVTTSGSDAVCRHAKESPILEDTNEYVIFMRAPFPPDAELNAIIMDHLAHHRGVKLEGFRTVEAVEQLTTEYMATRWNVQPARVMEIHDTVCQKLLPVFPFKKMRHSEFIDGLADPTQSEKILDVPMSHRGAPPPFGLMDDGYDAWNNTSSQYDWPHGLSREQWSDMNWGLLHHAATYTDEHHDADGKVSLIVGEAGSKLWVVTFPKQPLDRKTVTDYFDQALQFHLPTEEDKNLCISFTLVLLPGDLYFQPSGAIHAVYTPEASFTRGASFWSLDMMHQVELSRRYDSTSGMWSTNLDHPPERVYEGLVRMMLSLPTNPDKLRYKRSLAAFLLMILDPAAYIPMHARAYGIPIQAKGPTTAQQDMIDEAASSASRQVKSCPWAAPAVGYAKRVAGFIGLPSKRELERFLQSGSSALSDPGEKISISPVLWEILREQSAAQDAEEQKELDARQKVHKPKKQKAK